MSPRISTTASSPVRKAKFWLMHSTFKTMQRALTHCCKSFAAALARKIRLKVGLEATGHYSCSIHGFLHDKGLPTYVLNPLHTNLYRKSLSSRKTKADRVVRSQSGFLNWGSWFQHGTWYPFTHFSASFPMPTKSPELQHTICLICELDAEIEDIKATIQSMNAAPITTIPGIGFRMGAMILAEIGGFSRFDSPDQIFTYAGVSLSIYQSGQLSQSGAYSHMEKRGSRYLRYALYNVTK